MNRDDFENLINQNMNSINQNQQLRQRINQNINSIAAANQNIYCTVSESTKIYFNILSPNLKIKNNVEENKIFNNSKNWNAELLGIGGLNKEFNIILRRAFMSRLFDSQTIEKLGIQHVKGILLYGPPGCGKTLIARQIGKMISGVEPKIVEGPSILNKYVGESEKNIRDLFADA